MFTRKPEGLANATTSRRTLVKGAAWTTPVLTLAAPAPAYAASQMCRADTAFGYSSGGPTISRSAAGDTVNVSYRGNGMPLVANCPSGATNPVGYWGWALPSGGVSGTEVLSNVDPSSVKIFLALSTPYPVDYRMDASIDIPGEFAVDPPDALAGLHFPVTAISYVNGGADSADVSSPALTGWNAQSGSYPGGPYPVEETGYYTTLQSGVNETKTAIPAIPGQVRMVIALTIDLTAFISSSLDSTGFMATPNISLTHAQTQ